MAVSIIVTNQVEGLHCYPEAPEEVKFLRDPHRHIFHIKTTVRVTHNDRDLEFIMVKRRLQKELEDIMTMAPKYVSCEMIGERVVEVIQEWYGKGREVSCEVWEDAENGALVTS